MLLLSNGWDWDILKGNETAECPGTRLKILPQSQKPPSGRILSRWIALWHSECSCSPGFAIFEMSTI